MGSIISAKSPFGSPCWHTLCTRQPLFSQTCPVVTNQITGCVEATASTYNIFHLLVHRTNAGPRSFWVRILSASHPGCPRNIYKLMVDCWWVHQWLDSQNLLLKLESVTGGYIYGVKEWNCHTANWVHIWGEEKEAFMQWLHLGVEAEHPRLNILVHALAAMPRANTTCCLLIQYRSQMNFPCYCLCSNTPHLLLAS